MARGEDKSRAVVPRRNPFRQEILDLQEIATEESEELPTPGYSGSGSASGAQGALEDGKIIDSRGKVIFSSSNLKGKDLLEHLIQNDSAVLSGANLSGVDLRGLKVSVLTFLKDIDLSGADLSGAVLEGITFKGGSIKGADFSKARLSQCSFEDVDIDEANFQRGDLFLVTFSGKSHCRDLSFADSNLNSVTFNLGSISNTSFLRSNITRGFFPSQRLIDCDFTQVRASEQSNFSSAHFIGLNLSDAAFDYCRLAKAVFATSVNGDKNNLSGARFAFCNMKEVDLQGVSLAIRSLSSQPGFTNSYLPVVFLQTNLDGAYMRSMDLENFDFGEGVTLNNAVLEESNLNGVNISGMKMRGVQLAGASMQGTILCDSDLRDSTLTGADLTGANLSGTNLKNADLWGALFEKTNLRRTKLQGTAFSGLLGKIRLRLKKNNP